MARLLSVFSLTLSLMLFGVVSAENREQSMSIDEEAEDSGRQSTLNHEIKYAKLLTSAEEFEKLRKSSSVGVVFFYKKHTPQLDMFFSEYDKSAGFMGAYGITLAIVDCSAPVGGLEADCKNARGDTIFTYRQDTELLDLDLDTMFDVNSIMSNILQLALLNEVTIIQSKANRQVLERESAGQTDIMYAYHTAIGTYEHRVFMEIAYAYQDKYRFILTTEPASVEGLQDANAITSRTDYAMWVLHCRESYDAENGCRSVNYRGEFNLFALAKFLRALSMPKVFYDPEDGTTPTCELDDSIGCVYIEYPPTAKEEAKRVIDSIQYDVHGFAQVVVREIPQDDSMPAGESQKPRLTITKAGQPERIMLGENWDWTLSNVEVFITSILFSEMPSSDPGKQPSDDSRTLTDEADTGHVDEIDDMVLNVAHKQHQQTTDIHNVPALTDKTFTSATADSKMSVILFYLPFDARSMAFLLQYQDAATELAALNGDNPMAHPLMRVSCYDWTDVCQKANVSTYPQIHIYRNGGERQQYMQALDKDVVVRTVRLLQLKQPLMLKTKEEVEDFVGGLLPPAADKMTDNVVLMKTSKSNREMEAYKSVVKSLETQMLFAVVGPEVNTPLMQEAGVMHVRLTDMHLPIEKLTSGLDAESIKMFLLKGQFHLLPELTHKNFPALYARQQPFGILFTSGESRMTEKMVADIAKSRTFPDLILCKMSVLGEDSMASSILEKYTDSMSLPTFAVVRHREGQVFVLQEVDFTQKALTAWIKQVLDGTLTPTRILEKGEWRPVGKYYDFLTMMEKEPDTKYSSEANKHSSEACPSGNCIKAGDMADPSGQNTKDAEETDVDIRASLLELQNSRLYHSSHRKTHPHPGGTGEAEKAGMEGGASNIAAEGKDKHVPHTEL